MWEKAEKCSKLIQKYKNLNKDLKEYTKQKHNVGLPHYFSDILPGELDKAYIFGFLGHDGFLTNNGKIGLAINPKDKSVIYKLAQLINLDLGKIKIESLKNLALYKGEKKEFELMRLAFRCKPMYNDLQNLGPIGSKNLNKEVPHVIKRLVNIAKQKSLDEWLYTTEGMTALSWFLGAYDADGTYISHYSGAFFSSNKQYLKEIKELFEINTKVSTLVDPGSVIAVLGRECISKGMYKIGISSRNVFIRMMESYGRSLQRKRPDKYKVSS